MDSDGSDTIIPEETFSVSNETEDAPVDDLSGVKSSNESSAKPMKDKYPCFSCDFTTESNESYYAHVLEKHKSYISVGEETALQ